MELELCIGVAGESNAIGEGHTNFCYSVECLPAPDGATLHAESVLESDACSWTARGAAKFTATSGKPDTGGSNVTSWPFVH